MDERSLVREIPKVGSSNGNEIRVELSLRIHILAQVRGPRSRVTINELSPQNFGLDAVAFQLSSP